MPGQSVHLLSVVNEKPDLKLQAVHHILDPWGVGLRAGIFLVGQSVPNVIYQSEQWNSSWLLHLCPWGEGEVESNLFGCLTLPSTFSEMFQW